MLARFYELVLLHVELLTEDRMVVDQEKSSLWLNGEREGDCVVVNPGIRRVVDFRLFRT